MKQLIVFLKAVVLFITAIWGVVFGVLGPLAMLTELPEDGLPAWIYRMWLITAAAGFILPCFLVMLRFYKTAAVINLSGAVSLFVMHTHMRNYTADGKAAGLYMPLVFELIAVILIAVFANLDRVADKINAQKEAEDAPAPSVLGDGLYEPKKRGKGGRRKK